MTITATTNRIQYTGDGSSTGFAFPFRIFAATDLEVFLAGVLQTTGYSVTGGSPSGTVNFAAAPGAGVAVLIRRAVPATQPMDLVANDPFPAETAEAAFDRNTILAIQMAELIQTCLRLPRSEALVGEMAAAAARANKYLGFDTSGAATLVSSQPAGPGTTEAYWWGGTATGSASAHVVTVSSPPSAYADGQRFYYRAPAASTGATTVNINGLGALPIRKGDGTTALSAGDIPAANALVGIIVASGGTLALLSNIAPSVDLSTYAAKAAANTFTAAQTVQIAAAAAGLAVVSTDGGNTPASVVMDRASTSPAANDMLFDLIWRGRDDLAAARAFGFIRSIIRQPAAATIEGELQAYVALAGAGVNALQIRNGLNVGAASGGFQGTGTINATGYYLNGAAQPMQRAYASSGQAITNGGGLTLAHGLGSMPILASCELVCGTAELGYSAADVLQFSVSGDGTYAGLSTSLSVRKTATNLLVRYPAAGFVIARADTGAQAAITPANWTAVFRAFA